MERGEFRSFSSPPDFPSSWPSFSATVSAVRAEEDEVSFPPSPPYIVKNNLSPSKPSPILPDSFISPSPCPDSGSSSSSSSPFAFASASNLAFQRPPTGTVSSSTAACPSTLSYSPSAVRSRASVRAPGRVDYEDAYTHSGTFITRDGACVLPSHRMQRASVSKHLGIYNHGDERSGGNSAHAAEYYSAGEENDLSPVLPNYHKHVPLNASSLGFNVGRSRREHAFAVSTENAESGDARIAPFAANQRSCRVRRCRTAAESSVGAVSASGEHASTAEQLSTQGTPDEPQSNDGWQQQQQPGGKELQQQQPQQHGQDFLLVRQQWKDRFEPPLPLLSDGLQQGQRRRSVGLETLERRVQRLFQSDAACRLTRRAVPRGQQSLTVSSPSKSADVQLLLERMRMFYGSFSDAAAAASTSDGSAVPAFSPLNKGNSSSADGLPARTKMPPIPSCAENFRHATARRQRGLCGPADAGRRPAPGQQEADVQVYPRQPPQPQQASENELQKRGQTEVKTKKKKLRDRRFIFVCALLFLDVIIIGSTSTQHALNPASLVDKVLLTHVSFSASLCSLSGGSPAAVAECLASAAAGNAAAAAAASSGATGNRVDERTGLLSTKGQDQQQPDLPQLQQQLLQEPFLLPHFDRYLPHSFKRELGLSCVCGWAALVVLGVMCLWVAVRDTSVGAHVFPAVISARPGAGGGASVNKKEERTTVCDSSSLTSFSREGNNTCSSPNTSSRRSSPCSSPTDRKETFLSACGRVGEAGVCASFCGPACRSSSKSSSPACYGCSSCSTRPPETVMTANSSSSKSSGFLDRLLRPCRRRITAAESRTEEETGGGGEGRGAAAAAGEEGGALGSGRSRRRGLANVSSAEAVGVLLREYEETVAQEYQTRTFIQGRARLFCVSLLALLVFFGMNFVVQLNVRCHRTKYHFYTLQSLAAAARERGGNVGRAGGGGDMGRNSSREDQTAKRELPTTPNTPWLPLKMLLHAQQPAAASSAFYFGEEGEGGEEEMQQLERDEAEEELQPQDSKEGGGGSAETANDEGKQVEKRGSRPFNHKQGPRTSPSYVYYRDYQFWYQLFADSCRDAEMQLSVAWIVLHLTAVIMCRNMRREADENVRAALRAFRRRHKHLLCSGSRIA